MTRGGLKFQYVFQSGMVMTFLLSELLDTSWPTVLDALRVRHGAVLCITECAPERQVVELRHWKVA